VDLGKAQPETSPTKTDGSNLNSKTGTVIGNTPKSNADQTNNSVTTTVISNTADDL